MAQLQPVPVPCPVCGEELLIRLTASRTSDKAPKGPTAVIFITTDNRAMEQHIAAHVADHEEQAA